MSAVPAHAPDRVTSWLAALADQPRPAGSDAEAQARRRCDAFLLERGFETREEAFEYSAAVGRWATPACGLLALAVLMTVGHAGYRMNAPRLALAVLVGGGGVLAVFAWWLVRHGVLALPFARQRGTNLVGERGTPRVWLVAHLDTKSQPVPLLLRAVAIVLVAIAFALAAVAAISQAGGADIGALWYAITGFGAMSCLPVIATTVGSVSPGAVDNASGVVTVLEAAEHLPRTVPLGVLFTSGEELGLAGARAWVRGRAPGTAINVDGVDDEGRTTFMYSSRAAPPVASSLGAAAAEAGVAHRIWRVLPGVLTDSIALADAGWNTVTVSRGGPRTLGRIHTRHDTVGQLRGTAIPATASVIARAVEPLSA